MARRGNDNEERIADVDMASMLDIIFYLADIFYCLHIFYQRRRLVS